MSLPFDLTQIPPAVIERLCFAFDVDGTLTRKDHTIAPETLQAVRAIFQAGGTAGLCTGRAYATLPRNILGEFGASAWHVVAGGANIIDSQGEVVWARNLPGNLVEELIQLGLTHGSGYGFGLGKTVYANPERHRRFEMWAPEVPVKELKDLHHLAQTEIPELVLTDLKPETLAALETYTSVVTVKAMLSRHDGTINADITAKGVTKATGLLELARLRHIPITEIMMVGDDHNDVEVVGESWGVAMGNAVPELKAVAKLVIGHTDQNGLAEFILQTCKRKLSTRP